MDSAISATPIADRCMKSSTQPCNLHRRTMAVEWPYWITEGYWKLHRHSMTSFQQVISSNVCPVRAALVNFKFCYCEVETSRSNNGSAAKWEATQAHFSTRWSRSVSLCGLTLCGWAVVPRCFHFTITALTVDWGSSNRAEIWRTDFLEMWA